MPSTKRSAKSKTTENYKHPDAASPMRPEVGTQAQFKKKKAPQTYRYDSSLSPVLEYDGQNPAREEGEKLIAQIRDAKKIEEAKAAADKLKALSKPFLNWSGKAERVSFDVPTLPLFVHERLSTKAIIETLQGHKSDKQEDFMSNLFADPRHSVTDQVLRAYEYKDNWVNRLILGDSLVVMNSLLHYEALGGQVQMVFVDPPYGVKFGSNFQPFVRKRDVSHGDDEDMTREPEMVQAYRDTWELGLHSYLTYMRDRLLLARDLLAPSGSIFVQISDENLHHVRELMDEVFGAENCCSVISFAKTSGFSPTLLSNVSDFLLWYAKDINHVKYRQQFLPKLAGEEGATQYTWVESFDGKTCRPMTEEETANLSETIRQFRVFAHGDLSAQGTSGNTEPFEWKGETYKVPTNCHWKTTPDGLKNLAKAYRLMALGNSLRYKRYLGDFPVFPISNIWTDTSVSGFSDKKLYVVQTNPLVIQRCILMTTDPGDLVVDPTCGSGTTAYVAEQWGRRWITMDTSRVPLALARQRLLTATFPYYQINTVGRVPSRGGDRSGESDPRPSADAVPGSAVPGSAASGDAAYNNPAAGFVYKRKQNAKGEEVGGIVPHVTLKSIANHEPPAEEVLVDRPEETKSLVRVAGPFVVEATIPTPVDWEADGVEDSGAATTEEYGSFVDRMLEVLRKSPVLRLEGNRTVTLTHIRPPAKTLSLSAEAMVEAPDLTDLKHEAEGKQSLVKNQKPVAFVFGPENGAVSEKLVYEAAREAHAKSYTHLYVIGFAIQSNARELVEKSADVIGVPATYVQATPDLMMGDLLKNMRSSQIFSVCGLPEIRINHRDTEGTEKRKRYEVELLGMDVFDPVSMEAEHRAGNDVPCWLLDSDYNGLCFRATQVFFPRTSAWENLKRALKGSYEETVWDHLAGTTSAPFEKGTHDQIAVKVIDDRGNELLVVKSLKEAK